MANTWSNEGRLFATIGALALLVVVVLVLITGGDEDLKDASGDLDYVEGTGGSRATGVRALVSPIADITDSSVAREGDRLLFTVAVAADIPSEIRRAGLEFRWDLTSSDGQQEWIVSAALDRSLSAAVVSQTINYGAGTADGTMPGGVSAAGRSLTISLDPSQVPGFPGSFTWQVSSVLDADRHDVRSARVEDRFPDDGVADFGG